MKLNFIKKICTTIFCSFLFIGCSEIVLEYDSIGNLKVNELKENNNYFVEISGLCMHSSLNIDRVFHYQKNDSLFVEVFLTLKSRKGSSGNFKEKILIEKPIKTIIFGKNRKIIWTKD